MDDCMKERMKDLIEPRIVECKKRADESKEQAEKYERIVRSHKSDLEFFLTEIEEYKKLSEFYGIDISNG